MKMREVTNSEVLKEKMEFLYFPYGPGLFFHNYLCAVCFEEAAVLTTGPFPSFLAPCWGCQRKGYRLIKRTWFDRLFRRFQS